jgi:transposase-like protein
MAKNHYPDEFKQQILGLYKTGKTPEQLANDYQIGKSTVWK